MWRDGEFGKRDEIRWNPKILSSFRRAFDVELLFIAESFKWPIDEIAVNWTEIEGSKLTPLMSSLQMGRDLLLIWLRYQIGAWKLTPPPKTG
jgi:dolichyl-phosphate beta-glucosyltransferase